MGPYATRHQVNSFVSSIFNLYNTFLPIIKFERVNNQFFSLYKMGYAKKVSEFRTAFTSHSGKEFISLTDFSQSLPIIFAGSDY